MNKYTISVPWLGLLFAALVILKLLGKITISWWWVWAPLWLPIGAVLGIMGVVFLFGLIVAVLAAIFGR